MLQRLWLIPAFVCVFPVSVWAVDPNRHISQYAHAAWRLQDGFFKGSPISIAQTKDGYVWLGTASGLLRFDEEITAYEWPRRLDYVIVDVNIPLEHDGGSIRFEPAESGTHVLWTSTFRITTPLIGDLLGAAFGLGLKRSFMRMLEDSARLASAPAESAITA